MASLAQLVRMLASDADGECVAAARAIGRQLSRDGRDWHWFAKCVADCPHRTTERPKHQSQPIAGWVDWEACDIAAELLKVGAGRLSEWETEFLENMAHWDGSATPKQDAILRRIASKVGWQS